MNKTMARGLAAVVLAAAVGLGACAKTPEAGPGKTPAAAKKGAKTMTTTQQSRELRAQS